MRIVLSTNFIGRPSSSDRPISMADVLAAMMNFLERPCQKLPSDRVLKPSHVAILGKQEKSKNAYLQ